MPVYSSLVKAWGGKKAVYRAIIWKIWLWIVLGTFFFWCLTSKRDVHDKELGVSLMFPFPSSLDHWQWFYSTGSLTSPCLLSLISIGIYIGDNKVIHFTRRGQEVGTGTVLDLLLVSSGPARSREPCTTCVPPEEGHGVVSSCLDCFLAGGVLYRFEYNVNPALFVAKLHGGTCTLATSDPPETVVHRAQYLLVNGFGGYNVFKLALDEFRDKKDILSFSRFASSVLIWLISSCRVWSFFLCFKWFL